MSTILANLMNNTPAGAQAPAGGITGNAYGVAANNSPAGVINNGTRAKAKIYANIGYIAPRNGEFVSLPFGLGLDNMNKAEARGQDPEWHMQAAAQNAFLAKLVSLAPNAGQVVDLPAGNLGGLQLLIRIRHVSDKIEVSTDPNENPYMVDLDAFNIAQ